MRKSLLVMMILASSVGCISPKKTVTNNYNLNGIWVPVRQEAGGNNLPASVYENYELALADTTYSYTSHDKGAVRYSDGKMDIYGRDGVNAGKHYTAIYKMEAGQLVICYNLSGDGYPVAFETKSKPTLFLSVYRRK